MDHARVFLSLVVEIKDRIDALFRDIVSEALGLAVYVEITFGPAGKLKPGDAVNDLIACTPELVFSNTTSH